MRHSNLFEMIVLYLICSLINHSLTLSIGSSSDVQNLTKRETTGDFYPDWVPFKNKHGDDLGEFIAVTKRTPKKRLAPPSSFVLKAQSDQDSAEYDDKGQEENTRDDYDDKKEWLNIAKADNVDPNESDPAKIADIDGIVNIITNSKEKVEPLKEEEKSIDNIGESEKEEIVTEQDSEDGTNSDTKNVKNESQKEEDDYDYEDLKASSKENRDKDSEEQSENEAKKAKILDSVDELKERHAEEQRRISEKVKEEDEQERDKVRDSREFDKYNNKLPVKWRRGNDDYDEYDDKVFDINDKYKITNQKSSARSSENKPNTNVDRPIVNKKISLFTNPQMYLINEYEDSEEKPTTLKPKRNKTSRDNGPKKYSSRYVVSVPEKKETVRISLEPLDKDFKEGEPTLFFPKKKTGRRRPKTTTTTIAPEVDSYEAETVQESEQQEHSYPKIKLATPYNTGYESETTGRGIEPTAGDTIPSAADAAITSVVSEDADSVTDPLPSSTDHKEQKQPEEFEYEKGRDGEHHSSHEEEHEEHGKKAYEGKHEETKKSKGHHDKEDHIGKYDDHGGVDKHHHDESGHYGHHHHEEHGKKHAKYEESGKHSKGHSTKGSHDVHKKEEYEKNVEFFEEEGDFDEEEKHGGHHDEKGHSKGGNFKHENLKAGHEGASKDTKGHYSKGGFGQFDKGHRSKQGHDHHGRHGKSQIHQEGKEAGKKWIYHHGHPPRTANLVVIDRRADPYVTGPRYYG